MANDGVSFLFGEDQVQADEESGSASRCITADMGPTNLASVYEDRVQDCPPDETCRSSDADSSRSALHC